MRNVRVLESDHQRAEFRQSQPLRHLAASGRRALLRRRAPLPVITSTSRAPRELAVRKKRNKLHALHFASGRADRAGHRFRPCRARPAASCGGRAAPAAALLLSAAHGGGIGEVLRGPRGARRLRSFRDASSSVSGASAHSRNGAIDLVTVAHSTRSSVGETGAACRRRAHGRGCGWRGTSPSFRGRTRRHDILGPRLRQRNVLDRLRRGAGLIATPCGTNMTNLPNCLMRPATWRISSPWPK